MLICFCFSQLKQKNELATEQTVSTEKHLDYLIKIFKSAAMQEPETQPHIKQDQ